MPSLKNIHNLKEGDAIKFVNLANSLRTITITRATEKSCYSPNRESWGTINSYIKKFNAEIIRSQQKPETVKSYDGETDVSIKHFQESLDQWPDRPLPFLDDYGRAGLMYTTYGSEPCGCQVIGNGTLQFPISVKRCKTHDSAPELLGALKLWRTFCDVGEMPTDEQINSMDKLIKKATL